MKKNFLFLLALLCTAVQVGWAQSEMDTVYVSKKDHPDAAYFLPEPPDTNSVAFIDDMIQWEWGKSQRNTPRGEQASRETPWLPEIMRTVMAEVLQIDTISDEKTPALSRLLVKSYHTGNQSTVAPKETYSRKRPIVRLNEDTWGKYDSDFLRTNGSYPSGHQHLSCIHSGNLRAYRAGTQQGQRNCGQTETDTFPQKTVRPAR